MLALPPNGTKIQTHANSTLSFKAATIQAQTKWAGKIGGAITMLAVVILKLYFPLAVLACFQRSKLVKLLFTMQTTEHIYFWRCLTIIFGTKVISRAWKVDLSTFHLNRTWNIVGGWRNRNKRGEVAVGPLKLDQATFFCKCFAADQSWTLQILLWVSGAVSLTKLPAKEVSRLCYENLNNWMNHLLLYNCC